MQVSRNRQQSLAIRWILGSIREKKGRPASEKLAAELLAAYNREGHGHDETRKRPPHGRGQQGVRPFRLVVDRHGKRKSRFSNRGGRPVFTSPSF